MIEIIISEPVRRALEQNMPVVALESAVITHGLPFPTNIQTAAAMEVEVRKNGALPATICMLEGKIHAGIDQSQLERLGSSKNATKLSMKDFGGAAAIGMDGGTTVSGTMAVANKIGIKVFATGGIGGVHRNSRFDVSADLTSLSMIPIIVVCSGAKSILDLEATKEVLETSGVPVFGYRTDFIPAFYSTSSGIPVDYRFDELHEAVEASLNQWKMDMISSILLTVPPPEESALGIEFMEKNIKLAEQMAQDKGISGADLTPFLLEKIAELTKSKSLKVNTALLKNNATVAAEIAVILANS